MRDLSCYIKKQRHRRLVISGNFMRDPSCSEEDFKKFDCTTLRVSGSSTPGPSRYTCTAISTCMPDPSGSLS